MKTNGLHILIIPSERYVSPDEPLKGIFQYHQAKALRRAGLHVGVVAPAPISLRQIRRGFWRLRTLKQFEYDGDIPVYRNVGWAWTLRRSPLIQWLWLKAGKTLVAKYLADHGMPHLIHAHNALYAGALARVIFLKHELPYVITEHSSIYAQGGLRRWQVPLVHDALQTAQGRAVVSVALGELLETRFGEAASPWEWIPNILENEFETLDFEIQANSGHKHGLRFLTIGGLVEIKNQSNLLKAFSHKFKFEKNVELRIGGDGPLRKKLETEAIKLGVADRVVFLGWLTRQRVHEELRNCDAFVLSSNHETFGVVLIEALAYGKPLISTACEGPQCIIKAFNGVLVPPRDPISLGGAMWDVMRKREEYDSLLIRRDCLQRFGEQAIVARLIRFYRQAMSKDD